MSSKLFKPLAPETSHIRTDIPPERTSLHPIMISLQQILHMKKHGAAALQPF